MKPLSSNLVANSPHSLLHQCVEYVVREAVDLRGVSLPKEICDLLIQVYRETHLNTDSVGDSFAKFLSQFRSNNSRISVAKFADMAITDETLEAFLEEHSKTITHLDISNCSDLTANALHYINKILTRVTDPRKLIRTVRVIEEGPVQESRVLYTKRYQNGVITTVRENCRVDENVGIITDDYDLTQAMGIFDDTDFADFKARKLRDLNGIRCIDFDLNDCDEPMNVDYDLKSTGQHQQQPLPSLTPNRRSPPLLLLSRRHHNKDCYDNYRQLEVFSKNIADNRVKTLEIKTWQNTPLQSLIIGRSTHILPDYIEEDGLDDEEFSTQSHLINPLLPIRKLVIHEWTFVDSSTPYLKYLINSQMKQTLQHLDLSNGCAIDDGAPLAELKSLKTLILYNCPKLHHAINNIIKIKTLRFLDISSTNDRYGHGYKDPNKQLALIVQSLPELTRFDISGTNLAGPRYDYIPGLISRHNNPFEYLGLYNTANEAAYRRTIPAISVSGDATEEQILTGCEVYIDRVEFLRRTLNDLFHCFRLETNFHNINRALDIVLESMARHLHEKQIQIAASASLFYIVKSDEAKHNFNIKVKQLIITRLLDAMQEHRYDITMLRNGSLTLIHFKIPGDVIFEYSRLVEILLRIVTNDDDDFIQRLGIYLLNTLACQVDGDQKTIVGDLGAIDKMLALIDARLHRNICDEVMETAWSTMWNVTDETPVNCQRFLDNNGMDYFVSCMHSFPNSAELLRNMMGLLGNVAECSHLRHRLMKSDYIMRFVELLDSESDGIEVSYNAAGILSHIASDGSHYWQQYLPYDCKREYMLNRLSAAIRRWKINSKRNINYRSFEPILRLLRSNIPSEAQYWAVWALANLTRVYSSKYCPLLKEDNGIEVLEQLAQNESSSIPQHIRHLSSLTLYQYCKYTDSGELTELETSEDIDIPMDFLVNYSHNKHNQLTTTTTPSATTTSTTTTTTPIGNAIQP
ncbi:protein zer-1 homolog [Oppia nitens]|uniref:protein zer-1 homolog n=1 Tax=Oppia nitens TaxID=1686743 RepID=UPI0023DB67F3|nr:protein zer-1 homolog [Oppia nitens]XP_054164655.1 protein zer-1 homolog [Oppia nitens]